MAKFLPGGGIGSNPRAFINDAAGMWDGSTLYTATDPLDGLGFVPSASSSEYLPVVGPGTSRPIGFHPNLFWKILRSNLKISFSISAHAYYTPDPPSYIPLTLSASGIARFNTIQTTTNLKVDNGTETGGVTILRKDEEKQIGDRYGVNGKVELVVSATDTTPATSGPLDSSILNQFSLPMGEGLYAEATTSVVGSTFIYGQFVFPIEINGFIFEIDIFESSDPFRYITHYRKGSVYYDGKIWPAIDLKSSLTGFASNDDGFADLSAGLTFDKWATGVDPAIYGSDYAYNDSGFTADFFGQTIPIFIGPDFVASGAFLAALDSLSLTIESDNFFEYREPDGTNPLFDIATGAQL